MGNNNKNILLIGMTGCGKTTIGRRLAKRLNYKFTDMDNYIEEISQSTIKELFAVSEDNFRNWETEACKRLSENKKTVISSGGGVIKRSENMRCFYEDFIIIFIDRPIENIIKNIDVSKRPLLSKGKEVLYKLKEERYELYNKYCHYRVENITSMNEVVNEISNIVEEIE